MLFTTGYLTHKGCTESGKYRLVIPNKEVRNLFVKKIREWFSDVSRNDGKTLEEFCSAFVDKDSEKIEQIFGDYLWNTISIRDTAVAKEKKENFYHGILLGLLGYKSNWLIKSNAESGIGYSDILVEVPTNRTGIVIEIKYAEDGDLDAACEKALKQIEEKEPELEDMRALRFEPEYYQDFRKMDELNESIDEKHNEINHLMEEWEEKMAILEEN